MVVRSPGRNSRLRRTRRNILAFLAAYVAGACLTFVLIHQGSDMDRAVRQETNRQITQRKQSDSGRHVKVDDANSVSKEELSSFKSHAHARQLLDENVLADLLYNQVRILCWILTSPQNLQKKAIHVQATWSRRCNKVIFISSVEDPSFPTVKVDTPEGRKYLWRKTKDAFQYIYDHHLDDADWFLKADDDTYVVLENLRYMLADKNPSEPVFFGRRFDRHVRQGYMSGGAGYVLSKLALILAVEKAFPNPYLCKATTKGRGVGAAEDMEIGRCLASVGVIAADSRDSAKKETFHPFKPETHIIPGRMSPDFWFWRYVHYPTQSGPECCSDYSISFHYISPNNMYLLEYMIYHMRPFGVGHYTCPANMDEILSKVQPEGPGREDKPGKTPGGQAEVQLMKNEVKGHEDGINKGQGDAAVKLME